MFVDSLVNALTAAFGGAFFAIVAAAAVLCGLAGLLALADENRVFFVRLSRIVGIVVAAFGLLLPFRGVHFAATLLAMWWALQLFGAVPKLQIAQYAGCTVASLVFWIAFYRKEQTALFLQVCGDAAVFVLVPIVLRTVQLSKSNEVLGGGGSGAVPLRRALSRIAAWVKRVVPNQ